MSRTVWSNDGPPLASVPGERRVSESSVHGLRPARTCDMLGALSASWIPIRNSANEATVLLGGICRWT